MDDLIRQLLNYVRGTWHYRWAALGVAWLIGVIGTGFVLSMPNQYEASARIFVDTQSILKPLMAGLAIQPNVDQQVALLAKTLITRPNVEKVIRTADLDLGVKGKDDKERLVDKTLAEIRLVASRDGNNFYNIGYRDSNPDKAKKVVQALVTMFVESGLGDKRKDTEQAKRFLEEQIKQYEEKMNEAENRLKAFKLKNLALDEEFGKDYFTRVTELGNQIREARLQLREAENSRDALKKQLEGDAPAAPSAPTARNAAPEEPSAPAQSEISVPHIDGRLASLRQNLDELLRRYTEAHPDVVGTKRIIAQLEQERKDEVEKMKKAAAQAGSPVTAAAFSGNPVAQQLKIALAEAEATVASLKSRVAEYEGRLNRARQRAQLQPEIEAEFQALTRDINLNKSKYDELSRRRETAVMGGELDSSANLADFRLIEPPRVSPKPVAPNRPLLLSGVFLAALAAGLALAFLLSQARPTFYDSRSLREFTGLPVLGSVGFLPNEGWIKKSRRGIIAFLSGLGGLIAAYAGAMAFLMLAARGA